MNQVPSPQCPHCGRNLSTDDLRGQNCPSCGTALPHHARAAQQVALVNQMMAQHMAAPPPYATHQNPHYVHGMQHANQAMNAAAKGIGLAVGIVIGVTVLLIVVGAVVTFVLMAR
jgi:predicted amidophosphoribosyltransferase